MSNFKERVIILLHGYKYATKKTILNKLGKKSATHQSICGRWFYKGSGEYYGDIFANMSSTSCEIMLFLDTYTGVWRRSIVQKNELKEIKKNKVKIWKLLLKKI